MDTAEIATGYGVASRRVSARDELHAALSSSFESAKPELIEVPVAPGMHLF